MGRNNQQPCPNPLFISLLEKWVEEARTEGNKNKEFSYQKALKNLRKFPIPIQRGSQATVVEGIGPKIATRFDKELEKRGLQTQQGHSYVGPAPAEPSKTKKARAHAASDPQDDHDDPPSKPKRKVNREYVPTFRSGAYAIVRCLYQAALDGDELTKADIIRDAQQWTDASFSVPDPGKYQTAWSSMALLTKKDLVIRKGHPPRYSLSDEGLELAERMMKADDPAFVPFFNIQVEKVAPAPPAKERKPKKQSVKKKQYLPAELFGDDESPARRGVGKAKGEDDAHLRGEMYVLTNASNASTYMPVASGPRRGYLAHGHAGGGVRTIQVGGPLQRTVTLDAEEAPTARSTIIHRQGSTSSTTSQRSASSNAVDSRPGSSSSSRPVSQSDEPLTTGAFSRERQGINSVRSDSSSAVSKGSGSASKSGSCGKVEAADGDTSDDEALDIALGSIKRVPATQPLPPRPASCLSGMSSDVVDLTESPERDPQLQKRPFPTDLITPARTMESGTSDNTPSPFQPAAKLRRIDTDPIHSVSHVSMASKQRPPLAQSQLRPTASDPLPQYVPMPMVVVLRGRALSTRATHTAGRPSSRAVPAEPPVVLRPGNYDIVLLLDNREDRGYIQQKLQEQGVNCVIRMLQLGDFMWVARRRRTMDEALLQAGDDSSGENELVLGYIGERKRMDDLSSSIVDGRFREQHFRLSQCGLEHVIYLVENYGSLDSHSVAAERLQTAMVTVQVQHGFFLQRCINIDDSINYLTSVTKHLTDQFAGKTLATPTAMTDLIRQEGALERTTYASLSARAVKRQLVTATDVFAKQLMCMRLMTPERAKAIIAKYPTITSLLRAYERCESGQQCRELVAGLEYRSKKTVGKKLSEMLYLLYCKRDYSQVQAL